jgi:2-keto-3-deoxy-L-rhamnonate aldolase RhmA
LVQTATQNYLGESFTMICVDARHADNDHTKLNRQMIHLTQSHQISAAQLLHAQ